MRIGFTGSHRSGKSTLARMVSSEYKLHYIESPAGNIVEDYNFDLGNDNRLDVLDGTSMQFEILNSVIENLEGKKAFVTDRTPIDVAAYMLADATAGAGDIAKQEEAVRLVETSIRWTEKLFDMVILVPPVIDFVAEHGKPPANPAYQEHHHMLCRGLLFDEDLDIYWDELRRDTFSISERMKFVRGSIKTRFNKVPA